MAALFIMLNTFEIQFSPRESAASDPLDRLTEADIALFVDDLCLSELEDRVARTVRPTFRASSYRLALWLAENWWRLCYEPESTTFEWQLSHQLAAVGGGYVWPSLSMASDGESMTLRMRSGRLCPTQDIRYLNELDMQIPVHAFISGVDRFIVAVIERLRAMGKPGNDLEVLWAEIQDERHDPDTARWRKLEALSGIDPGAPEGAFLDGLLSQQTAIGPDSLDEWIAEYKTDTQATLDQLADVRAHRSVRLEMAGIEPLRDRIQADRDKSLVWCAVGGQSVPPWQRAYKYADRVREFMGIKSGPISNHQFAELLGTKQKVIFESDEIKPAPITAGFRGNGVEKFSVSFQTQAPTGRRFALTRLLGDYLVTTDAEHALPATSRKTARQKFQRAFAQQLLCPVEDLKVCLNTDEPTDEQIEETAITFNVSPLLVRTTLVNQGLLDRHALPVANPRLH